VKYDDASWHYGGDFPKDLPIEAGATHIAMFAVWAWSNGLAGPLITEDIPDALEAVKAVDDASGDISGLLGRQANR
jgi:hypothetical protein